MYHVTPHLAIDIEREQWVCRSCETALIAATEPYKKGCLVAERDPDEVHRPTIHTDYNFAPDPDWCRIVEFYCPECGTMIENEYLPPGHPITDDIRINLAGLRAQKESAPETPGDSSEFEVE